MTKEQLPPCIYPTGNAATSGSNDINQSNGYMSVDDEPPPQGNSPDTYSVSLTGTAPILTTSGAGAAPTSGPSVPPPGVDIKPVDVSGRLNSEIIASGNTKPTETNSSNQNAATLTPTSAPSLNSAGANSFVKNMIKELIDKAINGNKSGEEDPGSEEPLAMGSIMTKTQTDTMLVSHNKKVANQDDGVSIVNEATVVNSVSAGTFAKVPLSEEQVGNANIIIAVGNEMGASPRDIQIAIATAMQESRLRNLNYGHLDSKGLFQQRPLCGWGTEEQCTTPRYAAGKFYEGLFEVKNRNKMSLTQAAQAVQRSAYPNAYAQWESMAAAVLSNNA
ncbi:MAG: hypothetical protein DKM50_05385 [Candidatus Margulisiibacteriota bacterium]|nr:MAG: hypothetical protein A2X43_08780 [Candidatus Margulisbacteria bacterium GWD2_39_127]OGI01665.1 MAG: hypothetical protein A2X42_04895 [Candidatus Margulisbacteria bacterium GWF2_38_17]OGI05860.1 MAG: hypothetical protein A2X41_04480 [Candidatus Margulisbacteria bacterium GWE2_39_32]PZM81860.1 MAG: hypothetical protein DKM50_05385 [Candidatus Margulisiibacteriota bacterium]HAR63118.1 hypothetical protein [Candidatus Margulisiibacteriota bacterium]